MAANERFLEENKTKGGLEVARGLQAAARLGLGWVGAAPGARLGPLSPEQGDVLSGPARSRREHRAPERCARQQNGFVLNTVLLC